MPEIRLIPVDLIDPHPHNPRRDLGDLTSSSPRGARTATGRAES